MNCPYCNKEMKSGKLISENRAPLRWKADNEKLSALEYVLTDKGVIPHEDKQLYVQYSALYCESCGKIVMDVKKKM